MTKGKFYRLDGLTLAFIDALKDAAPPGTNATDIVKSAISYYAINKLGDSYQDVMLNHIDHLIKEHKNE